MIHHDCVCILKLEMCPPLTHQQVCKEKKMKILKVEEEGQEGVKSTDGADRM